MKLSKTVPVHRDFVLLLAFVVLKFAIQYHLISPEYDLHRDEYLHLDQANHLAWGYVSVPPLTSWISTVIAWLGNTVFWVKFFPALFGALTIIVVWKAVKVLGGGLYAQFVVLLCLLFSSLLRTNTLYQPNSLDVLCWTSMYYLIVRFWGTGRVRYLYISAVVLAIGFLNKYNILFLVAGLLPAVVVLPSRQVFARRELYLAALLFVILVSPNLWWQFVHGFPVISHMRELIDTQLVHTSVSSFLRSQLMYFIGGLPLLLGGVYALLSCRSFAVYRPLLLAFVFTLTLFLLLGAKSYYAMGLYPIVLAFGAVFLMRVMRSGWVRHLRIVCVILPILFFIPMYQYVFPNRTPEFIVENKEHYQALGLLRWEDGKEHDLPQDFADMLGWKELVSKVDSVYNRLATTGRVLVLCDNYGQAGAINYYTNESIRAVSFSADYLHWFDLSMEYTHLIRVKSKSEQSREFDETRPYFDKGWVAGTVTNPYARESGTLIFAFEHAKIDINVPLEQEVEREIQRRFL